MDKCVITKVENLIVEWLKSEDENATNLAHKICVLFSISNTEGKLCDKCYDTGGFYLGTTCPKCNRPFRTVSIKTNY